MPSIAAAMFASTSLPSSSDTPREVSRQRPIGMLSRSKFTSTVNGSLMSQLAEEAERRAGQAGPPKPRLRNTDGLDLYVSKTALATPVRPADRCGYASSHDCRVNCGLRSADRRGSRSTALRGAQRLRHATNRRPLPARKLADGHAQFAQTCRAPGQRHRRCVRPRIPGFSPGGLGPHLTSSGSPAGFPPVSRLPAGFSPFARLPLVSLRPGVLRFVPFGRCPGSGSPSASLRVPFP